MTNSADTTHNRKPLGLLVGFAILLVIIALIVLESTGLSFDSAGLSIPFLFNALPRAKKAKKSE